MQRRKIVLYTIAGIVGLGVIGAALGGDDDDTTTPPLAATAQPASTAPAEPAIDCVDVPQVTADSLAQSADADTASAWGAVKSPTSESWLVAVQLDGGPADGERAVFETTGVDPLGSVRAVDGFAKEFTGFPESAFSIADQPAEDAINCMS